jgi:hypothetical protein
MAALFAWMLAAGVAAMVCTVCFTIVIARIVKRDGWALGLVGLVFSPYAFIWGWRNAKASWGVMATWTAAAAFIVGAVCLMQVQMG